MAFIDDIQGQNTQLYPIVVIEKGGSGTPNNPYPEYILLSTNNINISLFHPSLLDSFPAALKYCKPLLLNIPSIKESIDIESKKFKISNVSLDISNFEYEGQRFSNVLSESSLINTPVSIYFKSPSTDWVTSVEVASDAYLETLCPLIFKGTIRRISHDDEKVRVELEDLTEKEAHKDLPSEYLSGGNDILDKYKNKPIPMVYGHVNRSPVVFASLTKLQIDYSPIKGLNEPTPNNIFQDLKEDSLYIHDGVSSYSSVLKGITLIIPNSFENTYIDALGNERISTYRIDTQWFEGSQGYVYLRNTLLFGRGGIQVRAFSKPSAPILYRYTDDTQYSDIDDISEIQEAPNYIDIDGKPSDTIDGDINTQVLVSDHFSINSNDAGSFDMEYNALTLENFRYYRLIIPLNKSGDIEQTSDIRAAINEIVLPTPVNGLSNEPAGSLTNWQVNRLESYISDGNVVVGSADVSESQDQDGNDYSNLFVFNMADAGTAQGESSLDLYNTHISWKDQSFQSSKAKVSFFQGDSIFEAIFWADLPTDYLTPANQNYTSDLLARFKEFDTTFLADIKEPLSKDFFVNVNGRVNTFTDHPNPPEDDFIQNPIDIIYDILRSELGFAAEQINEVDYQEAWDAHNDWEFAFTVNKKKDAKKLIEDIAKSTKCFPKFRNDGTFGFSVIKDTYDTSDYNSAHPIKQSDVISYSFKKTKPEQIYRQVDVQYNMDYAQNSLLSRTDKRDNGASDFYGIESPDDAYLEFESPYIRNEETAENLRDFLAAHYKNDHLIFNLKLPLQYIDLEIGELVKFEELFQGLKAYGIDYTVESEIVEGSKFYPLFIITSITKNLDSVSIECMQLHQLTTEVIEEEFTGVLGDLNQDGNVNILDVVQLMSIVVGNAPATDYSRIVGDLNEDGGLNVLDVVLMVNSILED